MTGIFFLWTAMSVLSLPHQGIKTKIYYVFVQMALYDKYLISK